jgi:hypothetical protein
MIELLILLGVPLLCKEAITLLAGVLTATTFSISSADAKNMQKCTY